MDHLLHVETKDVSLKFVFDHIRNYGICGGMVLAGFKMLSIASASNPVAMLLNFLSGGALLGIAAVAFALNLIQGFVAVTRVQEARHFDKLVFVVSFVAVALIALRFMFFAAGL